MDQLIPLLSRPSIIETTKWFVKGQRLSPRNCERINHMKHSRIQSTTSLAHRFFVVVILVFLFAAGLATLLIRNTYPHSENSGVLLPTSFYVTTALLLAGSCSMQFALQAVKLEQQRAFRRGLLLSLGAGILFVAVQSQGLFQLVQRQIPEEASTGVNAFVVVLASLHGIHFTIALLFLIYITLLGLADRYDHEYHWGVSVCTWFWHALGIAWIAILCVFAIAI